ncbi:MAG: hypothetical protein A2Y62_18440 [Candidatus Fischerbacteria bacterium RBG_13_37_8]|uniref:VIT domain-containing protein n=1 Tax=Candidatus Fischerbacteria bacterium RBG_13_37_8 TaxID=1817863 RepID=A0A1F5V984_9BACT|nr:MAG: hypothetical protein A2Y62_18440 [Candidatus Fischerbacteria bacterium RBG_13_37_8]
MCSERLRKIYFLVFVCLIAGIVYAQERSLDMVSQEGDQKQSMVLSELKVEVKILGAIAETQMMMTFYNPHERQLAGDLYFPLPEGAFVSGYALDINGVMVDGVVVEREKARVVFEDLTRRRIDPGLVEWTKGNNFKARVFPMPPKGSRKVMVRYITELIHNDQGTFYHLPLKYKEKVKDFSLRIELVKSVVKPQEKKSGFGTISFKEWQKQYIAELHQEDIQLNEDLMIELPEVETQNVTVQKNKAGDYYFLITDYPKKTAESIAGKRMVPRRIGLYWDASGSRGKSDHERELNILHDYCTGLREAKVVVELVVFRNEAEKGKEYVIANGNCEALIKELLGVAYDGGTQIGSLRSIKTAPDFYLLFTDGLSNFGKEETKEFNAPVYAISGDATANHVLLHYMANKSGGRYFNLSKLTDKKVVEHIGQARFDFQSAVVRTGQIGEAYPTHSGPAGDRLLITGMLMTDDAEVSIKYSAGGKTVLEKKYKIKTSDASSGDLLMTYWAQSKINELMIFSRKNNEKLVETGKKYGLVTPGTSLMVLDNLNQYVQYEIMPPETLSEMRKQYIKMMEMRQSDRKKYEQSKIDRVLKLWERRISWWETEYPKIEKKKAMETKPVAVMERQRPSDTARKQVPARPERRISQPGIGGIVTDSEGAPLPGATITLNKESFSRAVITDVDGFYFFGNLEPGTYNLRAEMEAFQANTIENINYSQGQRLDFPIVMEITVGEVIKVTGEYAAVDTAKSVVTEHIAGKPAESVPVGRDNVGYLRLAPRERKSTTADRREDNTAISIEPWKPDMPYSNAIKKSLSGKEYEAYLEQKKQYGNIPAFFLDCADIFFANKRTELGLRILSNIAELELENAHFLRILGHRLEQVGMLELSSMAFEEVLKLRPEEPQSWRDLALVLAELKQYERAIELLNHVIMTKWDRFDEIELIALMDMNAIIPLARKAGISEFKVVPQLLQLLDLDIRIVLTWDADMTDIDLWVIEPTEEKAFYSNKLTSIGGLVSRDFTQGYGPEEYLIKKAMKGRYKIQVNYYGSNTQTLLGPVTLQVNIFTNYSRPNEQKKSITMRLDNKKDVLTVGEIEL